MALSKRSYKYIAVLAFSLLTAGCSVEKNTDASRFYHSMTARYNIYFNGYESYKAGIDKISRGYHDDFAEMLNVFENSDPATVSLCSSDMETAIQKSSKLISLKSITSKPELDNNREISEKDKKLLEQKEYNEWVDDSYLLIGMARFNLHEFDEASALFTFCNTAANDPDVRTEASIWLARVHNETKNYTESNRILSEIDVSGKISRSLEALYYTTLSDLFIKQKRYNEAVDPLTRSIDLVAGKRAKYRLTYLLAQVYSQIGNGSKATALYRNVVRMNPPYDVEFNARINIAGVFDINSGNPEEMRKELLKMLKDSKNRDFEDQIFFALGNLSMKEGKEQEAIEYFRKSASSLSLNQSQKTRSFLTLANFYYEQPDYMSAAYYYDSAVYFMDEKHPDLELIRTKSQNLNVLVTQLSIIQLEDSLQRVALMPAADRNRIISGIIEQTVKAESSGLSSEYSDRMNLGEYYENERRSQGTISQEGKWYFYNQTALSFGRTEFRRRWGTRKLEDNWRRSNKAKINLAQITPANEEDALNAGDSLDPSLDYKNPEYYMKDLPMSDSLMTVSKEKVSYAMLNAGIAYAERIYDTVRAVEMFETLLSRFPESEDVPEALYLLYRITRADNPVRSETYRQRLLEKYPGSEYARILSDPEYYIKKMEEQKLAERSYAEAFNLYAGEQFSEAIGIINTALKTFPKDVLAPKFMLLRAYCVARISDERAFKEELTRLKEAWPGTEEDKKADEIIAFLNQTIPELKIEEERQVAAVLYTADKTAPHVFALIISDPAFNINLATFDVISYNIDNFTNKNYRTEGALVENKFILITVSGFADYNEALAYYTSFTSGKYVRNTSGAKMTNFIISNDNLNVLKTDRNPDIYLQFFQQNYLK